MEHLFVLLNRLYFFLHKILLENPIVHQNKNYLLIFLLMFQIIFYILPYIFYQNLFENIKFKNELLTFDIKYKEKQNSVWKKKTIIFDTKKYCR